MDLLSHFKSSINYSIQAMNESSSYCENPSFWRNSEVEEKKGFGQELDMPASAVRLLSLQCRRSLMTSVPSIEELASKICVERKGIPPMARREAEQLLRVLPGWILTNGSIDKEFHFKSYLDGLDFAYSVGKIAEKQDHHPDILIKWKRVRLTLSTHSVKGLSENDFIMAARSELKYRESGSG